MRSAHPEHTRVSIALWFCVWLVLLAPRLCRVLCPAAPSVLSSCRIALHLFVCRCWSSERAQRSVSRAASCCCSILQPHVAARRGVCVPELPLGSRHLDRHRRGTGCLRMRSAIAAAAPTSRREEAENRGDEQPSRESSREKEHDEAESSDTTRHGGERRWAAAHKTARMRPRRSLRSSSMVIDHTDDSSSVNVRYVL